MMEVLLYIRVLMGSFCLIFSNLASNQIQYVPRALMGSDVLPAIQTLILNSNKLTFLESGAFLNHTTLTTL